MPSDNQTKYQHQIPRTYLGAWGDTIYVYNKAHASGGLRNKDNIFGINYYYSIIPGDLFTRPESLDMFFSCLDQFTIYFVEKDEEGRIKEEILLDTKTKLNQYWDEFDAWKILKADGSVLERRQRNIIKTQISQMKDNYIEEAWSQQFEDLWQRIINVVIQRLWDIRKKESASLAYEDKQTLVEYYMMFDWRKPSGPKHVRENFDKIISFFPESINDYPWKSKSHPEDKSLVDAMWHMVLNSNFYKLFQQDGMIKRYCDEYMDRLTFEFYLDPTNNLITSDSPCFEHLNDDGKIEPIFVATPGLLIQLAKKNPENPLEYNVFELSSEDVERYNKIIFDHGENIIAKDDTQIKAVLGEETV